MIANADMACTYRFRRRVLADRAAKFDPKIKASLVSGRLIWANRRVLAASQCFK